MISMHYQSFIPPYLEIYIDINDMCIGRRHSYKETYRVPTKNKE